MTGRELLKFAVDSGFMVESSLCFTGRASCGGCTLAAPSLDCRVRSGEVRGRQTRCIAQVLSGSAAFMWLSVDSIRWVKSPEAMSCACGLPLPLIRVGRDDSSSLPSKTQAGCCGESSVSAGKHGRGRQTSSILEVLENASS